MDWNFSGYGTLAATYADTGSGQFRSSWRQHKGSQRELDFGVDSRLGVQLNLNLNNTFSGAAQLLALRRDGRDALGVEWLYAQAQLGPDTSVRVGRLALPAFMLSDVRNVGYAQHWVRTPAEVYLGFPVTSVDGAQLLYRSSWNGIKFTLQPTIGQANTRLSYEGGPYGQLIGPNTFRNLRGLSFSAERGDWLARAGQTVSDTTMTWDNTTLIPPENFKYTFNNIGLQYDNGSLLVMAELTHAQTSNRRYDSRGFYLSGGYRFGPWMPYATYAHLSNVGEVIGMFPSGRTSALGLRWDVAKDLAIKAQLERARLSGQQFIGVDPAADNKRSATIYTLGVDFVF